MRAFYRWDAEVRGGEAATEAERGGPIRSIPGGRGRAKNSMPCWQPFLLRLGQPRSGATALWAFALKGKHENSS
jgi:hypothetical protein